MTNGISFGFSVIESSGSNVSSYSGVINKVAPKNRLSEYVKQGQTKVGSLHTNIRIPPTVGAQPFNKWFQPEVQSDSLNDNIRLSPA